MDLEMDDSNIEHEYQKNNHHGAAHDDPFGNEEEGEVKYRTMSWW